MKTLKSAQWARLAATGTLLMALSACNDSGIPKAYQGTFRDAVSGSILTFTDSDGTMKDAAGASVQAKAADLKFDDISAGKPGIYLRPLSKDNKITEVIWVVTSDAASRQASPEMISYKATFLYTRLNSDVKDNVGTIAVEYCREGEIEIVPSTQAVQGGCPGTALPMTLNRAQ